MQVILSSASLVLFSRVIHLFKKMKLWGISALYILDKGDQAMADQSVTWPGNRLFSTYIEPHLWS